MSMTRTFCLGLLAAMTIASTLAAATTVFAKTARTKVAAAHDVGQAAPIKAAPIHVTPIVDSCRGTFVCRQDLFDRNNPNNLKSDWPGPPAQPAQF
jgi:hypothetical protein